MRIVVVRPSNDQPPPAGVRIRYLRLQAALKPLGHTLEVKAEGKFVDRMSLDDADLFLFSKCYDARSVSLAALAHARGKLCGVDLFDDYFSQRHDSRLLRRQAWLAALLPHLDFALCSTPRMAEVMAQIDDKLPVHVLNDPYESFDPGAVSRILVEKFAAATESKRIEMAWFGVGTNALFPIGLHDVLAWVDTLRRLQRGPFEVALTILTNTKSLDVNGLAMIRRLGLPVKVALWSEEEERALLERSLVAFLPVNAQSFSIAKSLNRAITALVSGTQILVAGHPLYDQLGDFLYTMPENLIEDLEGGALRVREETVASLAERLTQLANPIVEAGAFDLFLRDLVAERSLPSADRSFLLVHGWRSSQGIERYARQLEILTVASPFTPEGIVSNVRCNLAGHGEGFEFILDDVGLGLLCPDFRERVRQIDWGQAARYRLEVGCELDPLCGYGWPRPDALKEAEALSRYGPVMDALTVCLLDLFGDRTTIYSDNESPFCSDSEPALVSGDC